MVKLVRPRGLGEVGEIPEDFAELLRGGRERPEVRWDTAVAAAASPVADVPVEQLSKTVAEGGQGLALVGKAEELHEAASSALAACQPAA